MLILLIAILLGCSYSFAPRPKHTRQPYKARYKDLRGGETIDVAEATLVSDTSPPVPFPSLELDPEQGCIRQGSRVLLNGLDPAVWSSTSVVEGDDNSLFLHTRQAEEKSQFENTLGDLISAKRLLACARISRYWQGPRVGKDSKDVPFDTQFMLLELDGAGEQEYALLLPLIDNGFRASLYYGGDTIDVVCAAESGDAAVKSKGMRALYVATGNDPFKLIKKGFAQVAEATGTFRTLDQKQLPPNVDEFSWCTWDSFYSKVTPEGVLKGVESLRDAGVPPQTLILDDGWQQVSPTPPDWEDQVVPLDAQSPNEFEFSATLASSESLVDRFMAVGVKLVESFYENFVRKAPNGSWGNKAWKFLSRTVLKSQLWNFFDTETDFNRQLDGFDANFKFDNAAQGKSLKDLVSNLKQNFGVKRVFCWHALHGYWRGVSEELGKTIGVNVTNVYPSASDHLLRLEPQLAWDPVSLFGVGLLSTESDLAKFYNHLHAPLVAAGVDGVKVDVQSGVSAVGDGVGGGPHIARLYTEAMENSVAERFPSGNGAANCINCMCHSTENLYRYKSTSVARASDDFYPERPESQTVHVVNVAYNSLFIGEICLPDWDMFQSKHESAGLHAAARAVGGCPVYVSDKPGNHDIDLLKKLILPDGSVLRAKLPGRPTRDCLFVDVAADDESALKIWNENSCGGVVGAFNVQGVRWNYDTHENEVLNASPPPVTAIVKPHDVETLRDNEGPFVAWRQQSKSLEFLPHGDSEMKSRLDHQDWEIFTISPVHIHDHLMWGPIGLADMMNSGGGLLSADPIKRKGSSTHASLVSRGPGRFVAFTNASPSQIVLEDNRVLPFDFKESTGELSFVLPKEDLEGKPDKPHRVTVRWDS
jgi:raffinose synthase